jgi:hypothetical protein
MPWLSGCRLAASSKRDGAGGIVRVVREVGVGCGSPMARRQQRVSEVCVASPQRCDEGGTIDGEAMAWRTRGSRRAGSCTLKLR